MTDKPSNPGEVLREAIKNSGVRRVRCAVCGVEHQADSESFYAIYGDIHMGVWSPLLGANYTPEVVGVEKQFVLKNVTVVCKGSSPEKSCLVRMLRDREQILRSAR